MSLPLRGVVFVDLDSTLCDTTHRHHLIDPDDREATDWEAYSLACEGDVPFPGPCELVRMLYSDYYIVVVTGRSDAAKAATIRWLYANRVPFNEVLMRPAGDQMPNEAFKVQTIRRWLNTNPLGWSEPSLVIDDWFPAHEALSAEGWTVLMVNPMYAERRSVSEGV